MVYALIDLSERVEVELGPENVVYIDGRDIHVGEVHEKVGNVLYPQAERDFRDFKVALEMIKSYIR